MSNSNQLAHYLKRKLCVQPDYVKMSDRRRCQDFFLYDLHWYVLIFFGTAPGPKCIQLNKGKRQRILLIHNMAHCNVLRENKGLMLAIRYCNIYLTGMNYKVVSP